MTPRSSEAREPQQNERRLSKGDRVYRAGRRWLRLDRFNLLRFQIEAEVLDVFESVQGPRLRAIGVIETLKDVPIWDVRAHVRKGWRV